MTCVEASPRRSAIELLRTAGFNAPNAIFDWVEWYWCGGQRGEADPEKARRIIGSMGDSALREIERRGLNSDAYRFARGDYDGRGGPRDNVVVAPIGNTPMQEMENVYEKFNKHHFTSNKAFSFAGA